MNSSIHPYLNFASKTAEALGFYQTLFGGELQVLTFAMAHAVPEDSPVAGLAMHAELRSPLITILASDTPEGMATEPARRGNDMSLCVVTDDEEQGAAWFAALAEGGTVTMPFDRQMWGDMFGMLIDRFGIRWMVNVHHA